MKPTASDRPVRIYYVESSALVASILEDDRSARVIIEREESTAASALTLAEARRAILRAQMAGRISADELDIAYEDLLAFARRCVQFPITDIVLARAGAPFPAEPIRMLDAIHLATALELRELPPRVCLLTRDHRVRANAIGLGFQVA